MITEQNLIDLGFEKTWGEDGHQDPETNWYYYAYDLGDLTLITLSNDEIQNDDWKVEIFNCDSFSFSSLNQLNKLIDALKSGLIEDKK
jgi:hypothetical protein